MTPEKLPDHPQGLPKLDVQAESSFSIELAEVPAPREHRRHAVPEACEPIAAGADEVASSLGVEAVAPQQWERAKTFLKRGFFDPFNAFGDGVDWGRFYRAQLFLVTSSFVFPFLFLFITSFISAVLYHGIAALYSKTPPNSFIELLVYPLVYIFLKKYWIAYLVLPAGVLVLGWIWAAITARLAAKHSGSDVKTLFSILAMLGAMFAPFTMFSFIRIIVILLLLWYTVRKMSRYFDFSFIDFVKCGGWTIIIVVVVYSFFERKVESIFGNNAELASSLNNYYLKGQKLVWPKLRDSKQVMPSLALLENLGSLDAVTREQAVQRATSILERSGETPEIRFRLACRLGELDDIKGMLYVSNAYRNGQGVPQDYVKALEWIRKATAKDPQQAQYRMEEADLLFLNKRALHGKRLLVALAKADMGLLQNISQFITKRGYGAPDWTILQEVDNLYRQSVEVCKSRYWRPDSNSLSDRLDQKSELLQRIANADRAGNQWFCKALVAEYAVQSPAPPEVYGELESAQDDDDLRDLANSNVPSELDAAGDRFFKQGDVVSARKLWAKASTILDSDHRMQNAPLYMKLAESYDPNVKGNTATNPRESIRYFLAYLLLTNDLGTAKPTVISSLDRLGVRVEPDSGASNYSYLSLCTKYDVPEAWAILGSYHLGGIMKGVPKDAGKARECFQRAKSLGYKGPLVRSLD